MLNYKNGISPVVTVILLMLATVIIVSNFGNWFNLFQSNLNTKNEQNNGMNTLMRIDGISDNLLYIYSNAEQELTILKFSNGAGEIICDLSENNYSITQGMNTINISSCSLTSQYVYNVYGFTNKNKFEEKIVVD